MILDRTWNKKEQKLVISYIEKDGSRKFYQKYLHHIKSYEYDADGEFETWNGKRCRRVFKDTSNYTPNEFDILEFMYEMEPDINKLLHSQYFSKMYTWDIETKFVPGQKPDPENAPFEVTSISLVGPDLSCIVYGLKQLNTKQIELLRTRYLEWINTNVFARKIIETKFKGKTPKVLYQYFASEKEMLEHWFTVIVPKCACLAGWNSYNFDWTYLVSRIKRLFGYQEAMNMLRKSSPTNEVRNLRYEINAATHGNITVPRHTLILDYMKLVDKYDRIVDPKESLSLDWIASNAPDIHAHKIPYDGTLEDLYEKDPEWYYYYNGIDSLLVMLIHYRLRSFDSPCAVSSVTLVPVFDAMGQVALTTANVFEEFYKDNKKVVWDYDAIERYKVEYEGAFCNCVPGRYEWNVCDDFASLYPSQVQTCNFSFENFITPPAFGPDSLGRYVPGVWTNEELERYRNDPNYFVSIMGNVYRNDKDYAFKKMQRRIKQNRDKYKYTGQEIDSILLVEIDKLIEQAA